MEATSVPTVEVGSARSRRRQRIGAHIGRWCSGVEAGEVGSLPIIVGLLLITIFFQTEEQQLPHRRQLRQPDRPACADGDDRVRASCSCCCSARSTSRSATSAASRAWSSRSSRRRTLDGAAGLARDPDRGRRRRRDRSRQGSFVAFIGVPSFVVTLAGLLIWQGMVQKLIGATRRDRDPEPDIFDVANYYLPDAWGWIARRSRSSRSTASARSRG